MSAGPGPTPRPSRCPPAPTSPPRPRPTPRDDDEQVTTSGPGALRLDWKVRVDGAVHDLGSQTLSDLGFTVTTTHDGERLRTALQVNAHGVMWTWADVVALGDLDLDMVAYTAAE